MELFSDDSDTDDSLHCSTLNAFCTAAFVELVKFKPLLKRTLKSATESVETKISLNRRIALLHCIECALEIFQLKDRLLKAKFEEPKQILLGNYREHVLFDAVVFVSKTTDIDIRSAVSICEKSLVPGGLLLFCTNSGADLRSHFPDERWIVERIDYRQTTWFCVIRKRAVICNTSGAIYWAQGEGALERERALLESVSVPLSLSERRSKIFSDESYTKAKLALQQYGLCILPGLFKKNVVLDYGHHSRLDMQAILDKLEVRGISLFVQREDQIINNFHEMSMREALRCDIRNGKHMKEKEAEVALAMGISSASLTSTGVAKPGSKSRISEDDLRMHPAVVELLLDVMNPSGGELDKGNWGRYNFEEGGPEVGPPPISIGKVGTVMSLPGCADQTIHADTAHLYTHSQLPGHYFNLFAPAVDHAEANGSLLVGQTAFIAGSHVLETCMRIMVHAQQDELEARLIRPHLGAGDALIFDCRILHFGLANQTAEVVHQDAGTATSDHDMRSWRPMMYVNYHQKWFTDPKNWNDAERLFP